MIGLINAIAGRFMILVLIASLTPEPAIAGDGGQTLARSIRHSSSDAVGPIGTVDSFSPIKINGRIADYHQSIWDGDLIETHTGMMANVFINSIGQVALTGETTVRLSTKQDNPDDRASNRLLIAALIKGDVFVKLDQRASAYIEAGESAFTASEGASFRVMVRDDRADIDVKVGTVTVAQDQSGSVYQPTLVSAKADKGGRPTGKGPDNLAVPKDASKTLAFLASLKKGGSRSKGPQVVLTEYSPTAFQTGVVEQPLQDAEIEFTLSKPIGTLNGLDRVIVKTNNYGVARVVFKAGQVEDTGHLIATLVGYNVNAKVTIKVVAKPGLLRKRNLLIMAGAAAAIIGTIIVVGPSKEVEKIPPPIIIP